MYTKHTKTVYENNAEPFDHTTVLKVGDIVVGRYGPIAVKGQRGIVTRMVRSKNEHYGFVDWYIKVEFDDGFFWSTGPGRWLVVEPAVGSLNRIKTPRRRSFAQEALFP